jgi:hypothetical protein
MLPYFLLIGGIMTMCVPDDTSLTRFLIQGCIGFAMFIIGVAMLEEESYRN